MWQQQTTVGFVSYGSGFTIGCGASGGCWTGVSGFAATLQGNVNGGLIIAF
jgi:hypothetical protein